MRKDAEVWIRSTDEASIVLEGRSNGKYVHMSREDFDALLHEAGYHQIA